jgi:hypothetical protein
VYRGYEGFRFSQMTAPPSARHSQQGDTPGSIDWMCALVVGVRASVPQMCSCAQGHTRHYPDNSPDNSGRFPQRDPGRCAKMARNVTVGPTCATPRMRSSRLVWKPSPVTVLIRDQLCRAENRRHLASCYCAIGRRRISPRSNWRRAPRSSTVELLARTTPVGSVLLIAVGVEGHFHRLPTDPGPKDRRECRARCHRRHSSTKKRPECPCLQARG